MPRGQDPGAAGLISRSSRLTVSSLFAQQVEAGSDRTAIVDGGKSASYRELDERTWKLASHFSSLGIEKGDRIAVLARNCIEYLEIEIAAAKIGCILAALNWRLVEREMRHCIELVEPSLIIGEEELVEKIVDPGLRGIPCLRLGEAYEMALAEAPEGRPSVDVDPEDGLAILYTSGTTGLPKGALISHRALIARAMCYASELEVPRDDHFCAWLPMFHMASNDQSIATLMRGGTVHVVEGYEPEQLIRFLKDYRTGLFFLTPGMIKDFIADCEASGFTPKGIGVCGAMADLVPVEDIARITSLLDAPYLNSFGSTETGLPPATASTLEVGKSPASFSKLQSAFCEVRLVDADDRAVPVGEPGELAVRGPTLFSGYWNAPEVNEEDFRGGWFHLGDLMRRNEDGSLDYVDRKKYMIKSGGENIYPAEIELALKKIPHVDEAAVVKRPDEKWGERPVAFVVLKGKQLEKDDIIEALRRELSSYKIPKDVYFVENEDLPRSTTGKIQRHLLEQIAEDNRMDGG